MGRRRTRDTDLPPRMRRQRNLSGESYFYTRYDQGRVRWIHIGHTYSEAIIRYADLEQGGGPSTRVRDLIDRYEREVLPDKAPATRRMRRYQFQSLRQSFGSARPHEVTPQDIGEYLDRATKKVMANRNITALSAVYRKAIRWGLADRNPCEGIELNRESRRDRDMTDAEFLKIKAVAPEMVQCLMDLAYATAARKGDMLALRWDQVDEDGIRLRQGKTGRKQLFERTPALTAILDRCKALGRVRSVYVICRPDGRPLQVGAFDQIWQRLKRKAGVPDVHFHDIRRKAANDAKDAGRDPQALLGHTTPKMTARYLSRWERITPLDKVRSK